MAELVKKRSKKSGLPPGSLIHIGDRIAERVTVTVMDYGESGVREFTLEDPSQCVTLRDSNTVTWINVEGLHNVSVIEGIGKCFGLHPLVMEDILNTDQRPKAEDYGEYLYLVMKMLHDTEEEIVREQISMVLGNNYLITFQEGVEGDVFGPVRDRIRTGKGKHRGVGADYLAYSLIDAVVDHYFVVLEDLGERIEALEDELLETPTRDTLAELHDLKREMVFLRKNVWPLREVLASLERGGSDLFTRNTRLYIRDVYDHVIQVIDFIENSRDMLAGMLDIYLSSVSNRMNEVMKFLTVIGTIFIPLTFIAGVYGMNFKNMPELEWPWAYFALWGVMAAIGLGMLYYFRRKNWL